MHWHYLRALLHTQCWRECTAERGEGKQPLPQRCAPSSEAVEQQACTQCGARDWQTDSPCTQPSLAFLRAAVVNVLFVFFTCGTPGCTGLLQVSILLHLSSCCACFCGGRGLILIFDSLVYRWTAKSMAAPQKQRHRLRAVSYVRVAGRHVNGRCKMVALLARHPLRLQNVRKETRPACANPTTDCAN